MFYTLNMKNKKAFTLLEIIIVIIIVSVLATLALGRYFSLVEKARGTEALLEFSAIRRAVETCVLMMGSSGGDTTECYDFDNLTIEDPSANPDSSFNYSMSITSRQGESPGWDCSFYSLYIYADRKAKDGYVPGSNDYIQETYCPCGTFDIKGFGVYKGMAVK